MSDFNALMEAAETGSLVPDAPRLNWWTRLWRDHEVYRLEKGVYLKALQAAENGIDRKMTAATQNAVVSPSLEILGNLNTSQGTTEKTGQAFQALRRFAHMVEPAAAIINTRCNQVAKFSKPTSRQWGYVKEPGFHIRLTDKKAKATAEDEKNFLLYTQFFAECGWADPPREERPTGWMPGFEAYLRMKTRDRLELDWTGTRKWASAENASKYPIVSFCAVDAALLRRRLRVVEDIVNGRIVTEEAERERTNTREELTVVKVDDMGEPVEQYTDGDIFVSCARPRTDESVLGYGYSELEQAWNACTIWCAAREYNQFRFTKDALPRGILSVLGNLSEQQFQSFQVNWRLLMQGVANRWTIPMLRGPAQPGSAVNWTPLDLSPRDMEYSQFTYNVSLWLHAIYCIHPDETGFSASSPFRPPLSEASPETSLKYSQDTGLDPLMRWHESDINRNLLWVIEPSRRYTFEFLGMEETNETDDTNTSMLRMQAGIATPRMEWNRRDVVMPDDILNHPAADFPMPFAEGYQLLSGQAQQQQAQGMQARQQMGDEQQQGHEQDMDERQQSQSEEDSQRQAEMQEMMAASGPGEGQKPGVAPGSRPGGFAKNAPKPPAGLAKSLYASIMDKRELRVRPIKKVKP